MPIVPALGICAVLAGAAFFLKFCVPGYSFSALICLMLLGIVVFYALVPLLGDSFPRLALWLRRGVTGVLAVGELIDAAKRSGTDYAVDVYPCYGSDVEATLNAGYDLRHGLIGPGVYASHGYERSHIDGVYNTLKLLSAYLGLETET